GHSDTTRRTTLCVSIFRIFCPRDSVSQAYRITSAGSSLAHLVGPNLETLQGIGTEGAADGGVGGVATAGNQDASDARDIIAGVEGVPMAVKVGLEPGGEIHRAIGRRHADVAEIAGAVTCGDVHAATESDGEVCVITANAGPLVESPPGSLGARVLVDQCDMQVDVVADCLDAPHPVGELPNSCQAVSD